MKGNMGMMLIKLYYRRSVVWKYLLLLEESKGFLEILKHVV